MEKQEENGHFCSMGMLRKVGTGEEGQVSSGEAARRCDALIFACTSRGLGVLERSRLKWEGAGWNCSKKAGDETQGKTSLLRSTGRQSQGTFVPLAGGRETQVEGGGPRGLAPPILQWPGGLGRQDFCWDRRGEEESIQPQAHPQAGSRPSDPRYLAAQVRGSGRVQPGARTEVGVGPLRCSLPGINRPPSVPSPRLLPTGSRMSVFLLRCFV